MAYFPQTIIIHSNANLHSGLQISDDSVLYLKLFIILSIVSFIFGGVMFLKENRRLFPPTSICSDILSFLVGALLGLAGSFAFSLLLLILSEAISFLING